MAVHRFSPFPSGYWHCTRRNNALGRTPTDRTSTTEFLRRNLKQRLDISIYTVFVIYAYDGVSTLLQRCYNVYICTAISILTNNYMQSFHTRFLSALFNDVYVLRGSYTAHL